MEASDIKQHVRAYYRKLFQESQPRRLPVKTGKALAQSLGYPLALPLCIDGSYWENFLPCGNPFPLLRLKPGDRLLNLGCGAAIDSFLVQAKFDFAVEVVNLDIVFNILKQGSSLSAETARGIRNEAPGAVREDERSGSRDAGLCIEQGWICGDGEDLPLRSECLDWILMNGSLNLFPDKSKVLFELWRVLKPSGSLIGADLCASASVPELYRREKDAWAWCISGACTENELSDLLQSSGFKNTRIAREEEMDMFYRVSFSCSK